MLELTSLWGMLQSHPWLAIPLACALLTSLILWTGRIRQPGATNFLVMGMILPGINISLLGTGVVMVSDDLLLEFQSLVELLPL